MRHTTTIEREYLHGSQTHVWWFRCVTCGVIGEKRLAPKQAERDEEQHVENSPR